MKRNIFICWWLCLCLSAFVFSCRENKPTTQKYLVGISHVNTWDNWRRSMIEEMRRELTLYPDFEIDVLVRDAEDDSYKQIDDIKDLIAAGIDLLIISPNDAQPLTKILVDVYESGIPTILLDRAIDSDQFTAFIGANNQRIGEEAGRLAEEVLKGRGQVLEFQGKMSASACRERSLGFQSFLKNNPKIKVHPFALRWSEEAAEAVIDSLNRAGFQVDLVFAHNDKMAISAATASARLGLDPYVIGVDGFPDGGIQMVAQKVIDATFLYPTGGDKAIQTAIDLLQEKPVAKRQTLFSAKVDTNNVRTVLQQGIQMSEQHAKIDRQQAFIDAQSQLLQRRQNFLILSWSSLLIVSLAAALIWYLFRQKERQSRALKDRSAIISNQNETIRKQRDGLGRLLSIAEEATTAKDRFFANLSHDFKQVLTMVSLPLQKLTDNPLNEHSKANLQLIQRNVQSLNKLASEILQMEEVEKQKHKLEFEETNVSTLAVELLKSFEATFAEKSLDVQKQIAPDVIGRVNAPAIEKILFNLIANAAKFSDHGGTLIVRIWRDQEGVGIEVQDEGPGIPQADLDRVFDRFYRVDQPSIGPQPDGSGLGLAIVKELVELHHGRIEVDSSLGTGTTFRVLLIGRTVPAAMATSESIDFSPTVEIGPEKKLLIVEDDRSLRSTLARSLSKFYQVSVAGNGAEGLELIEQYRPDLIISDIYMPSMDGIEFCRYVKEKPETFHIPVILLTAMPSERSMINGFDMGADAYVTKPFSEEVLLSRIRNLLADRQQLNVSLNRHFDAVGINSSDHNDKAFIQTCIRYIHQHLSEGLTIAELAQELAMSRTALARKIKRITGIKPGEFLRKVKLTHAAKLLLNTDMTVREVAFSAGFHDSKYFSRCFSKEFGQLPSQFRKAKKLFEP